MMNTEQFCFKAAPEQCQWRCRDITGRLTMQTSLGLPEDPIIW